MVQKNKQFLVVTFFLVFVLTSQNVFAKKNIKSFPDEIVPAPMAEETPDEPAVKEDPIAKTVPVDSEKTEPPLVEDTPAPKLEAEEVPVTTEPIQQASTTNNDPNSISPTRSLEEYEKARKEDMFGKSFPTYGYQLTIAPRAFMNTDFRRVKGGAGPGDQNIALMGLRFSGEYFILEHLGLLSAGLGIGTAGTQGSGHFSNTWPAALLMGGPNIKYQFNYFHNQILVPTIGVSYEWLRYGYKYNDTNIIGARAMPRLDLGLMLFLNPLERSAAGSINATFGIKRSYAVLTYTTLNDTSRKDLDLSEKTLFFGIRLEQ